MNERSRSWGVRAARPAWAATIAAAVAAAVALLAVSPAVWPSAQVTSQPIEDPSGNALRTFYRELDRARRGRGTTRILHYGDSHVAADFMTGVLRRQLQETFGDGGPGFINLGKPWVGYSRPGVTIQSSSGWQTNGLTEAALDSDGRFGLAGVSLSATASGAWLRVTAEGARFEVALLKQPRGGKVDVLLDGVAKRRGLSLSSKALDTVYVPLQAAPGTHTIEIRLVAPGAARVFGIVAEKRGGVVYDALGINGARASRPPRWDWRLFTDALARRNPDLIVVAYGTNEVDDADLDLADYRERFQAMLEQFHQAAPRASLLVIGPPDRAKQVNRQWRTVNRMAALVEAQRSAALEAGAAFYNLFEAMGASGSIDRWAQLREPLAQPDRVHLTQQGYALEAGWLYSEFLAGYSDRRRKE